jgi:hypothetical protein
MSFFSDRDEQGQIEWIQSRIEQSLKRMDPYFTAAKNIQRLYNNDADDRFEAAISDGMLNRAQAGKANMIFGWVDQHMANMVEGPPTFKATPGRNNPAPQTDNGVMAISELMNHNYREAKQIHHDEATLLDAFLAPYGVQKVGIEPDLELLEQQIIFPNGAVDPSDDPADELPLLESRIPVLVTADLDHDFHIEVHKEQRRQFPDGPDRANIDAHIDFHERIKNRKPAGTSNQSRYSEPYAEHWPYDQFLLDNLSRMGLLDAKFCAFGFRTPLADVLNDPSFDSESLKGLKENYVGRGADTLSAKYRHRNTEELDEEDGWDMVYGWEIWLKDFPIGPQNRADMIVTIAEGHDRFLRKETEWPYDRMDNYPAGLLTFNRSNRSWHNNPVLHMAGADKIQSIVNEMLDATLAEARKQRGIWLYDRGLLDDDVIGEMEVAPDNSWIGVDGLAEMMRQHGQEAIIMPLPHGSVPSTRREVMQELQQFFDRSAGTPQPVAMPQSDTATEANIFEERNTSRENRRHRLFSEFQNEVARKKWQLYRQFKPDHLQYIDPQLEQWVDVPAEIALGEYDFTIDISSKANAKATQRSLDMDLLNLLAGLAPLMQEIYQQPPNIAALAARVLKGSEIHNVDEILPMLKKANEAGQIGPQAPGSPEEQVANVVNAQGAVEQGQGVGNGIGPINPDTFNRNLPNEARQEGAALNGN